MATTPPRSPQHAGILHRFGQLRQRLGLVTALWLAVTVSLHLLFLIAVNVGSSTVAAQWHGGVLALSPQAIADGYLWTPLTSALLHDLASPLHFVLSALALYFLGPPAERALGRKGYLRLVIAATVVGGLLQVAWQALWRDAQPVLGDSAAMLALVAHLAWSRPQAQVLVFFALPLQARYLIWVVLGLDLLMALSGGAVPLVAHLGALAVSWFLIRAGGNWNVAWVRLGRWIRRAKGPRLTVVDGGQQDSRRTVRREDWN